MGQIKNIKLHIVTDIKRILHPYQWGTDTMNILHIDPRWAGTSLRLLSTLTAGLFTGGALYINIVESPARATHEPEEALRIWRPSFVRAKKYLSKLAVVSGLTSVSAAYCLSGEVCPLSWFAAGCAMLTIPPLTMVFIVPGNNELMDENLCNELSDDAVEEKLAMWNRRHAMRSLIALGSFTYMVWLISKGK